MAEARGGLLSAYLIVGADKLKAQEALTRLKRRLEPGFEAFNLDERTAAADMSAGDLLVSLNTLPLGSGFRLVLIHEAERLPKKVSEALISYLESPNPDSVLLLVAEKLAKNTRLYKALAKVGARSIIDCTPAKRWDLPKTVVKMAAKRRISIDEAAASELISRVGESTLMLDQQVHTLAQLCAEAGRITRADVEHHVARVAEVKPWDFLDAVSARDARRALELYALMSSSSELMLVSLITGRLRELICAKSLAKRGQATGAVARELKKQEWQIKHHGRWAQRFSGAELAAGLASCAAAERSLKGGGDASLVITQLVLDICAVGVPRA